MYIMDIRGQGRVPAGDPGNGVGNVDSNKRLHALVGLLGLADVTLEPHYAKLGVHQTCIHQQHKFTKNINRQQCQTFPRKKIETIFK